MKSAGTERALYMHYIYIADLIDEILIAGPLTVVCLQDNN